MVYIRWFLHLGHFQKLKINKPGTNKVLKLQNVASMFQQTHFLAFNLCRWGLDLQTSIFRHLCVYHKSSKQGFSTLLKFSNYWPNKIKIFPKNLLIFALRLRLRKLKRNLNKVNLQITCFTIYKATDRFNFTSMKNHKKA